MDLCCTWSLSESTESLSVGRTSHSWLPAPPSQRGLHLGLSACDSLLITGSWYFSLLNLPAGHLPLPLDHSSHKLGQRFVKLQNFFCFGVQSKSRPEYSTFLCKEKKKKKKLSMNVSSGKGPALAFASQTPAILWRVIKSWKWSRSVLSNSLQPHRL